MNAKKIMKTIGALLAILVLAVLALVIFWLGPTLKNAIEKVGPQALGTPVTIESLSIKPLRGTLHLSGFTIANPDNFNHTNAVSVSRVDITLDIASLLSETILINTIQIDRPSFTYEQGEASDNIHDLIKNILAYTGSDPDAPPEEIEDRSDDRDKQKSSKAVIVQRLEINDIQIHLANTADPQLDVNLSIEQLAVSMTNGVVRMNHLAFSNPNRLATPNLFELDGIAVKLAPESIYAETLIIEDVQIIKPYAYLEKNAQTTTVIEFLKIADGIRAKKTSATAAAPPATTEPVMEEPKPSTAPPFELRHLLVDDIQLKLLDSTNTNAPAGPQTLAAIGSISVKLVEGAIQVQSITIPNLPAGFTTTNLFHLANIDVTLDPATLFSDQLVIKEIFINSPLINLEQSEISGNVAELQLLIESLPPPAKEEPSVAPPPIAPSSEEAPTALADQPVILESLVVTNLSVNMTFPTNTTFLGKFDLNPSQKLGALASALNPMGLMGDDDAADEEIVPIDGQLVLLAFKHLSVTPLQGLIELSELHVGNPEGFVHKNLLKLDNFQLEMDPDTIPTDVIHIREILIDNPTIAYERKLSTDNIEALQEFIQLATVIRQENLQTEAKSEPAATQAEDPPSEEQGKKVIIDHLYVKSGLVKAKISALPSAPLPLPKIELHDMGKETDGTSIAQALSEIGQTFYDAILGTVSGATGFATDAIKGLGNLTIGALIDDDENDDAQLNTEITEEVEEVEETQPTKKQKTRNPARKRGRTF